jgi:glycosyltransferase involved in cell wall biosynthesis
MSEEEREFTKVFQAADFFILPSVRDKAEKCISEAWAARIPIITRNIGIMKDFIMNKHNGLLYENDSVEAIAEQYFFLKDHPDLRVKLIHNAYEEACEKCSWPAVSEKVLDFSRKVIENYKK